MLSGAQKRNLAEEKKKKDDELKKKIPKINKIFSRASSSNSSVIESEEKSDDEMNVDEHEIGSQTTQDEVGTFQFLHQLLKHYSHI